MSEQYSEHYENGVRRVPRESEGHADVSERPGAGSLEPDNHLRVMARVCVRLLAIGAVVYGIWVALAWVIDAQP
jgi:hypothetical protein